jgi:hypothetical protein
MGKLDKKVLKFITAHQDTDVDVLDIAIELRRDDDEVQEALDSLKDQGLVESVSRDGKTKWQLSMEKPLQKMESPGDTGEFDFEAVNTDRAAPQRPEKSLREPVVQEEKPESWAAPSIPSPKQNDSFTDTLNEDTDDSFPPHTDSRVVGIIITVVISVVISAIVALMVPRNSGTSLSNDLQALERKSTETNAKTDQRIEDLSRQVKELADKLATSQQPKAAATSQPSKSAAKLALKPVHPPRKKKVKSAFSGTTESTAPASSDESSTSSTPATEQSPSPASSGTEDNAAPAPSPSTEGNNQ